MDALLAADVELAVGPAGTHVPDALPGVEPEPPVDLEPVMAGYGPEAAFDERVAARGVFLGHPTLLEQYGATDRFHAWTDTRRPRSVAEWGDTGGVGLLCDVVRPLRIE